MKKSWRITLRDRFTGHVYYRKVTSKDDATTKEDVENRYTMKMCRYGNFFQVTRVEPINL